MDTLRRFCEHRLIKLALALVMLLTGLSEVLNELAEDIENLDLGAEHGMVVFGLFHLLKVVPEFFEAVQGFKERVETAEAPAGAE